MIGIIDYGSGNIHSLMNLLDKIGTKSIIIDAKEKLKNIKKIIMPGVGSFDNAINNLHSSGLYDELNKCVLEKKIPIMGICIGMQIMCQSSEEGSKKGLGWFKNNIKKLQVKYPLPHMGWNNITTVNNNPIFTNIDLKTGFYFLHSYYLEDDNDFSIAITNYEKPICAGLNYKNIYGFQFHPEKSHKNGEILMKNFIDLC